MIYELDSALTTHFITALRDAESDAPRFRQLVKLLALLLADDLFENGDLTDCDIDTWQGRQRFACLDESNLLIVTVLRAGLPMLEALMEYFPQAQAGFLAIKRDETTHRAKLYFDRVPDCTGKHILLVDPMVATGGSLIDAMEVLKDRGAARISSLNIIGAPEGLERVTKLYPDLDIHIAQIDDHLNGDKYIIPGLGDAGDRAYNTL